MTTIDNTQTIELKRLFPYQNLVGIWETMYIGNNGKYYYQSTGFGIQKTTKEMAKFKAWNFINNKGGWIANFAEWESKRNTPNQINKILISKDIQDKRVNLMILAIW